MKEFIKDKLQEAMNMAEKKTEAPKPEKKAQDGGGSKYNKIQGLLSNEIFNHSEIIRQLWGEDNATKRSLFRKKLHRMGNGEGSTYEFNDDELSKISAILMKTSTEIKKKIGKNSGI